MPLSSMLQSVCTAQQSTQMRGLLGATVIDESSEARDLRVEDLEVDSLWSCQRNRLRRIEPLPRIARGLERALLHRPLGDDRQRKVAADAIDARHHHAGIGVRTADA